MVLKLIACEKHASYLANIAESNVDVQALHGDEDFFPYYLIF